jgi:hypothetical protein
MGRAVSSTSDVQRGRLDEFGAVRRRFYRRAIIFRENMQSLRVRPLEIRCAVLWASRRI